MPYPNICNKCKKEIAFQDGYRASFNEYYCSSCWNSRPLKTMPPKEFEHGCEKCGDFETQYCCFKEKGETLKLRTIPDDPFYDDTIEVKYCPFCGYTIPEDRK